MATTGRRLPPAAIDLDAAFVWRPVAANAVAWREWDGEIVIYNDVTGDTHHLSRLGSHVLQSLLLHPSGIAFDTLVIDVARHVEVPEDVHLAHEIERTLRDLAELRLANCDRA
jgi:PqqD family protein of HPr-rel-A system